MTCDNDCRQPAAFPQVVYNRPGLDTIDYRIGSYADLRDHMLSLIDADPLLAAWTHRLADDPGIALIEAAAEVGDILSFYQDLYANEAWLRTAKWRDSVAALVRLLGYRLAPGIAGNARFAFAVTGMQPVLLPAGLQLKAQLDADPAPAVFETTSTLLAQPALSQFNLYRPRRVPDIRYGTDRFALVLGASVSLKAGDRVMVGLAREAAGDYDHMQVLVVDSVSTSFGDTLVTMKGGVTSLRKPPSFAYAGASTFATTAMSGLVASSAVKPLSLALSTPLSLVSGTATLSSAYALSTITLAAGLALASIASAPRLRAWKLGATHRHFGCNAPAQQVAVDAKGRATTSDVSYERRLDATTTGAPVPALAATQMPLDGEVSSMVAGTHVLVEANIASTNTAGGVKRLLERVIAQVDRQSLGWGPLSGASTVLTLDSTLAVTEGSTTYGYADVRGISFHEVVGESFELHADYAPTSAVSDHELWFQGSAADAAALAKRRLLFAGADGTLVAVNALAADSTGIDADQPGLHRVQIDREVDYAQFAYDAPQVTVYGNLADATQGKTEAQVALGDGDGRAVFQTFALPKTPLTYLLDTTRSPPQQPQMQVWVDSVEWRRVDSLFGAGPKDHVYIVREDDAGQSWVQFGDGKTGARLRSGRGNVVAVYRTGDGANGPLKADAKPQVARKVVGLDKAFLLEPVTGGSAPEAADGARAAAPGTMQSLGRIVSLADHEAEALAIPGVVKARAAWVAVDGQPLVRVTLLTESAAPADAVAAADALRVAVRARGAGRCPLLVVQGARTGVSLQLTIGIDPTLRADDLRVAVLEALGATGDEGDGVDSSRGLFSWQLRQFGESVHGSQVVAAVQNVPGVTWVRLTALRPAGTVTLPWLLLTGAMAAATPATQRALACAGDRLLALASTALQLQFVADKEASLS
jgi:hypothetical protein